MINYNEDDLKKLAILYNKKEKKLYPKGTKPFNYVSLINKIYKKSNKDIKKTILEFMGAYNFTIHDNKSFLQTYNFIFKIPLSVMPLFVNNPSHIPNNNDICNNWKYIIAQWRLSIGK